MIELKCEKCGTTHYPGMIYRMDTHILCSGCIRVLQREGKLEVKVTKKKTEKNIRIFNPSRR